MHESQPQPHNHTMGSLRTATHSQTINMSSYRCPVPACADIFMSSAGLLQHHHGELRGDPEACSFTPPPRTSVVLASSRPTWVSQPAVAAPSTEFKRRRIGGDVLVAASRDESSDSSSSSSEDEAPQPPPKRRAVESIPQEQPVRAAPAKNKKDAQPAAVAPWLRAVATAPVATSAAPVSNSYRPLAVVTRPAESSSDDSSDDEAPAPKVVAKAATKPAAAPVAAPVAVQAAVQPTAAKPKKEKKEAVAVAVPVTGDVAAAAAAPTAKPVVADKAKTIPCQFAGCGLMFSTVKASRQHYSTKHGKNVARADLERAVALLRQKEIDEKAAVRKAEKKQKRLLTRAAEAAGTTGTAAPLPVAGNPFASLLPPAPAPAPAPAPVAKPSVPIVSPFAALPLPTVTAAPVSAPVMFKPLPLPSIAAPAPTAFQPMMPMMPMMMMQNEEARLSAVAEMAASKAPAKQQSYAGAEQGSAYGPSQAALAAKHAAAAYVPSGPGLAGLSWASQALRVEASDSSDSDDDSEMTGLGAPAVATPARTPISQPPAPVPMAITPSAAVANYGQPKTPGTAKKAGVTDQQLTQEIGRLVRQSDPEEVSVKSIRQALEAQFGCDLTARKDLIRSAMDRAVTEFESETAAAQKQAMTAAAAAAAAKPVAPAVQQPQGADAIQAQIAMLQSQFQQQMQALMASAGQTVPIQPITPSNASISAKPVNTPFSPLAYQGAAQTAVASSAPMEHMRLDLGLAREKLAECLQAPLELIDRPEQIDAAIRELRKRNIMAVDCEGINMDRRGLLCVVSIATSKKRFVFDTVLLGKALFDQGLRAVLEDTKSIKIFFDARRDSDAMYHQFGVKLQCVLDCQILDLSLRKQSGLNSKFRTGLSACLENYLPDLAQQFQFKAIKKQTVTRFAPEQGGDPELWGKRPMDQGLLQYATFDVVFLRVLAATIQAQLQPFFNSRAWEFSALNVASIRDLADHEITKENSSAAAPAGF